MDAPHYTGPVFDADNHFYETQDALTRYLPARYANAIKFVQVDGCRVDTGYSGKLSMGIGGINSCVISRPWDREFVEEHLPHREAVTSP